MASGRKIQLERIFSLVRQLSDTTEGLTIDEMASCLGQGRRSAERTRKIIELHFDLEPLTDGLRKRWRIPEGLRRHFIRPNAEELAALQAEAERQEAEGAAHAHLLQSLLEKIRASYDVRERRRLGPDLEVLEALHRGHVGPGPRVSVDPAVPTMISNAMLSGRCLEFEYSKPDASKPGWRRVICCGVVHGPITYLVGKMPDRDLEPVLYRVDRIASPKLSDELGLPPENFNLDDWLSSSFGVWRGDAHEVSLRVLPGAATERARNWCFHPKQRVAELSDGGLRVQFHASGMRELAEHLFTWAGELLIEGPDALATELSERLRLAVTMLPQERAAA